MKDVIIIGAGSAGLTAAIYAVRAGLNVVVLERFMYGGQISTSERIENFPSIENISGPELAEKMFQQALKLGADIRFEDVLEAHLDGDVKTIKTNLEVYEAKTVIIASGVRPSTLNCAGEEEFKGRGVSYCATCDGAFFRGKSVAVAGGGNSAAEEALFLAKICEKVHLVHRREELKAEMANRDALKACENIIFHMPYEIESINGDVSVNEITIKNKNNGETEKIPVSGVFVAIGKSPDNKSFSSLELDEKGYIIAGESCKTNLDGVFAAGDCRTKTLRQIVTAVADGAVAANQAGNFVNKLSSNIIS